MLAFGKWAIERLNKYLGYITKVFERFEVWNRPWSCFLPLCRDTKVLEGQPARESSRYRVRLTLETDAGHAPRSGMKGPSARRRHWTRIKRTEEVTAYLSLYSDTMCSSKRCLQLLKCKLIDRFITQTRSGCVGRSVHGWLATDSTRWNMILHEELNWKHAMKFFHLKLRFWRNPVWTCKRANVLDKFGNWIFSGTRLRMKKFNFILSAQFFVRNNLLIVTSVFCIISSKFCLVWKLNGGSSRSSDIEQCIISFIRWKRGDLCFTITDVSNFCAFDITDCIILEYDEKCRIFFRSIRNPIEYLLW